MVIEMCRMTLAPTWDGHPGRVPLGTTQNQEDKEGYENQGRHRVQVEEDVTENEAGYQERHCRLSAAKEEMSRYNTSIIGTIFD